MMMKRYIFTVTPINDLILQVLLPDNIVHETTFKVAEFDTSIYATAAAIIANYRDTGIAMLIALDAHTTYTPLIEEQRRSMESLIGMNALPHEYRVVMGVPTWQEMLLDVPFSEHTPPEANQQAVQAALQALMPADIERIQQGPLADIIAYLQGATEPAGE